MRKAEVLRISTIPILIAPSARKAPAGLTRLELLEDPAGRISVGRCGRTGRAAGQEAAGGIAGPRRAGPTLG